MPAVVIDAATADAMQRRVAGRLRAKGFGPGDRLGLCVASSEVLLHAIGGAVRAGVVPVVVNSQLTPSERTPIRDDADVREWIDAPEPLLDLLTGPPIDVSSVPLTRPMHYTSGTTGRPKGVWSGVLTDGDAAALAAEEVEQWAFDHRDVHLVCSPLQHSAPIRFALHTLLAGGTVVVPGPFSVENVTAAIVEHRPTTTFCTPAHLQRLDEAGRLAAFGGMRLVAHAGAPCSEPLKRRAIEAIGADRLWEFYGSTEGQFTVCSSVEWLERPGTVGRARAGRRLAVDDGGVIWCDVPAWARWSYWGDPERTAAAWRGDAFTVGDLGRLDDDGYLYLSGRRGDLIISGGVNVYPAEVERVLSELPGVVERRGVRAPRRAVGSAGLRRGRRARHAGRGRGVRDRAVGAVQAAEGDPRRRRDPSGRAVQGPSPSTGRRSRPRAGVTGCPAAGAAVKVGDWKRSQGPAVP